jgi:hypothetical protein
MEPPTTAMAVATWGVAGVATSNNNTQADEAINELIAEAEKSFNDLLMFSGAIAISRSTINYSAAKLNAICHRRTATYCHCSLPTKMTSAQLSIDKRQMDINFRLITYLPRVRVYTHLDPP